MTTWTGSVREATKFQLIQHLRNTFALALVLLFIPGWLSLIQTIIPSRSVRFDYHPTGASLALDAGRLATISGAVNAVTLIVGFTMFAAVRRAGPFDQRLVLAGYSRSSLLAAKLLALAISAAAVASYAGLVMMVFWTPRQPWLMMVCLFVSGLIYGGFGIVLGVVFPSELPGLFLIIMISLVDVMVQNPIINPATGNDLLRLLPTYGAMQTAVGAAFTHHMALRYLLISAQWLVALVLLGLAAFYLRTRARTTATGRGRQPAHRLGTATVILTSGADGALVVRSSAGPVVLCSRLSNPAGVPGEESAQCRC